MVNKLLKKELKYNLKILIAFMLLLTMYNLIMTSMYDPEKQKTLETMMKSMGSFMQAFGMKTGVTGLAGFLGNYLYGFIMILIPFILDILLVHRLVGSYIDDGSMAYILATPHKRKNIIINQIVIMVAFISVLILYCLALNVIYSNMYLPGKLDVKAMAMLNIGCLVLHLFMISLSLLICLVLPDTKKYLPISIGLFFIMYLFQMVSNMGTKYEKLKYFTYLSLFNPTAILQNKDHIQMGIIALLVCTIIFFTASVKVFENKDLHI